METFDAPPPSGVVLQDAVSDINTHVNAQLQAARTSAGARSPALEAAVYKLLGEPTYPDIHLAPIEKWANSLAEAKDKVPGKVYQPLESDSQYKTGGVIGGLAKVMLVAGIYIGIDKLGHFFQLAYSHYFKKTLGKAPSRDAVIKEGDETEKGQFGLALTGVYSRADLEANHAGLKFYEDLAASPNMPFDIRKYINQQWNEQANPNEYGGIQTALWTNNLDGTWETTFGWSDGSNTICRTNLRVVGSGSLVELATFVKRWKGTYQYKHPAGSFSSGELTGIAKPQKNTDGMVDRVDHEVEWKEGKSAGKGTLTMRSMKQMDGKWGRASSADNGGTWSFRKT